MRQVGVAADESEEILVEQQLGLLLAQGGLAEGRDGAAQLLAVGAAGAVGCLLDEGEANQQFDGDVLAGLKAFAAGRGART